ncbi:MAG: tRNA (guanosine(37)-N1)-methyltransferase TrmD [Candidatus Levybacteria bacterium]|nr:tRNA (guanosine(37)-N1)-methyltransferase TrmD [Candidatus Levybacteria bacterium]
MFAGPFSSSILKRAMDNNLLEIVSINIRDFGFGKHKLVDDTPYGGGVGMLMRVDVIDNAIQAARCKTDNCKERVILLDAGGKKFTQQKAADLSRYEHLILICPHYEGIDTRIHAFIDEELSIGDYVLTGGEIPAMVLTDTVVRLLPNVLGKDVSSHDESFQLRSNSEELLLEYPQYTKPAIYQNEKVPEILLSGHHQQIAAWKEKESKKRTIKNRPDLLERLKRKR